MHDALPHPVDFQLAQCCLEGDVIALKDFQQTYRQPVISYLVGAGASHAEACEVTENLWADCVAGSGNRAAKLSHYNGMCALQTWLKTVALNDLFTRKRREQRWNRLIPDHYPSSGSDDPATGDHAGPADESASQSVDVSLLEIMREAVQAAFLHCPAQDFVLLQLAHVDGLRGKELGRMFNRAEASISRDLEAARCGIEKATLMHIRRTDPWLELQWQDFVELCRVASPACFGLD